MYIAVELVVVHVRKVLLELGELFVQPSGEGEAYLVDFGVGKLYDLRITYLYIITLLVLNGLGYVGYGVVQRMLQQVVSVITSFFPFHIISVGDVRVGSLEAYAERVDGFSIVDMGLYLEKVSGELLIYGHGNPPFPQVEVKLFKTYRLRYGFPKGLQ